MIAEPQTAAISPTLPLIVGDGAPEHAAEALFDLLGDAAGAADRVSAAVRVGERRWNLRLDNGIDVKLPEDGAGRAWRELARAASATTACSTATCA